MEFIRIWTEVDFQDIEKHLIIVDDKFAFCPGCKEMGIKIEGLAKCPKCGREIKYVTSRESKGPRGFETAARVRKKLPNPAFIDYDDYERLATKKKAEGLFKDI